MFKAILISLAGAAVVTALVPLSLGAAVVTALVLLIAIVASAH